MALKNLKQQQPEQSKATTVRNNGNRGCCWSCFQVVLILIFIFFFIFLMVWMFFNQIIWLLNHLPGTVHIEDTNRDLCSGTAWLMSQQGELIIQTTENYSLRNSESDKYAEFDANNQKYYDKMDNFTGSTLGFVLASRGYDVWLGNYRGSYYSQQNDHHESTESEFWKFSIDELVNEDLPMLIDHIRMVTGHQSIAYIGHSQGSFQMIALLSEQPKYADRIKPFIALSPVFYISPLKCSLFQMLPAQTFQNLIEKISRNYPRALMQTPRFSKLLSNLCENVLFRRLCFNLMSSVFGLQPQNYDLHRIGVLMANIPMGSSSWNFAHFIQIIYQHKGEPHKFDYGDDEKNLKKYNSSIVPKYDPKLIPNHTEIALIHFPNDCFNSQYDVGRLRNSLSHVTLIDDYQVPDETMDHLAFLWSKHAGRLINERIFSILDRY